MRRVLFLALLTWIFVLQTWNMGAIGQELKSAERSLVMRMERMTCWDTAHRIATTMDRYDSLTKEADKFRQALAAITAHEPSSIHYPFEYLQSAGVKIVTSGDGRFRIYSWDSNLGGTMIGFENVLQFQTNNRVFSKAISYSAGEFDIPKWYSSVYDITIGGRKIFLAVYSSKLSTKDAYFGIDAFTIGRGNTLVDAKIIKTRSGLTNTLGFEYDFFSVVDRSERPIILIEYDLKNKIIRLPVVYEDGKVTNRWIRYKFTGKYFEKLKRTADIIATG